MKIACKEDEYLQEALYDTVSNCPVKPCAKSRLAGLLSKINAQKLNQEMLAHTIKS
jgi:hypothetical protein